MIDEILAVGDARFQAKVFRAHPGTFATAGKTIVMVTHNMEQVAQHCDRALLIEHGSIMADGPPDEVIAVYENSPEVVGAH